MNKKKSKVHFYINKTAHKEYAQHKTEFNAKSNLCSAVNTNILKSGHMAGILTDL